MFVFLQASRLQQFAILHDGLKDVFMLLYLVVKLGELYFSYTSRTGSYFLRTGGGPPGVLFYKSFISF